MQLPHLLGNSRLKEALASLPPSGLGSAVLLDGPAGIGKRTAAADLAAGLVCPAENGPCGVCPSCKRAAAASHPDLIWLKEPEPGKGVKLEQVRDLRAQSFLRPSEAPFKVFVIPQADKLNIPSQNALLKVLEEPASSVFVLLCENREAMLQTVRSRCKTFRLTPLSQPELLQALSARSDAPAEELRAAAAQADGLLGRALHSCRPGKGRIFRSPQLRSRFGGRRAAGLFGLSGADQALPGGLCGFLRRKLSSADPFRDPERQPAFFGYF